MTERRKSSGGASFVRLEANGDFKTTEGRAATDLAPCRIRARILSGGALRHWIPTRDGDWEEFAKFFIDLETAKIAASVVVDYNHQDDEDHIIGRAENFAVEADGLFADLTLYPKTAGDCASKIAYLAQYAPFGISPTVDLLAGSREDVGDEPTTCNGRDASNVAIFRGAKILGVAICPYPTDADTWISVLNRTRNKTELKMSDEINDQNDDKSTPNVKNEELQAYVDALGSVEAGFAAYQSGQTLEEAKDERLKALAEENARLKAAAEGGETKETPPPEEPPTESDGDGAKSDKDEKLSNEAATRLAASLDALTTELKIARTANLGKIGDDPVSGGPTQDDGAADYLAKLTSCIK